MCLQSAFFINFVVEYVLADMKHLLTLILLLASLTAAAMERRALVIGIGTYADKSWAKINGDRDVPIVTKMLRNAGYSHIRTLVNAQATKTAIVDAFRKLTAECRAGDIVYIHFSGHGQEVTDIDGDERLHGGGAYDQSWVPYDASLRYCAADRGDRHLIDDELAALLSAIRRKVGAAGKILVVADACHSGGSTRCDDNDTARGAFDAFVIPKPAKTPKPKNYAEDWITVSACKSYQTNYELRNPKCGKITYALSIIAGEGKYISNIQTLKRINDFINSNPPLECQTPTITGNTSMCNIFDFLLKNDKKSNQNP